MPVMKILSQEELAEKFLNTCYECGSEATLLCDAHISKTFELNVMPNKYGINSGSYTKTCSVPLCEKCATQNRGRDFCKFHTSEANRSSLLDIPDKKTRAKINSLSFKGYINIFEKIEG